jgi:hypothetical protein
MQDEMRWKPYENSNNSLHTFARWQKLISLGRFAQIPFADASALYCSKVALSDPLCILRVVYSISAAPSSLSSASSLPSLRYTANISSRTLINCSFTVARSVNSHANA